MGRHRAATTCSAWSTVSDVKWLLLYGAVFMESLSNVVSQHIPWFWGVLAWSLAILGLLAIAAIPAYFLFYPISTAYRIEEEISWNGGNREQSKNCQRPRQNTPEPRNMLRYDVTQGFHEDSPV